MSWLDIGKEIIGLGAPYLGFAVGGPAGAEIAADVAGLFHADSNNASDVLMKMTTDPEAAVKLKQIESDRLLELQRIHLDIMKEQYAHEEHALDIVDRDVEDARAMQEKTGSWMPHIITAFVSFTLCVSLTALITYPVPSDNKPLVIGLLVLLGWQFLNCCHFYIGGFVPTIKDITKLKGGK